MAETAHRDWAGWQTDSYCYRSSGNDSANVGNAHFLALGDKTTTGGVVAERDRYLVLLVRRDNLDDKGLSRGGQCLILEEVVGGSIDALVSFGWCLRTRILK